MMAKMESSRDLVKAEKASVRMASFLARELAVESLPVATLSAALVNGVEFFDSGVSGGDVLMLWRGGVVGFELEWLSWLGAGRVACSKSGKASVTSDAHERLRPLSPGGGDRRTEEPRSLLGAVEGSMTVLLAGELLCDPASRPG
jgi:hypothetical protein